MLKRTASLFGFSVRNHETTSHHSSPIHFTNKVMYTKNHVDNKQCQRSPSATHHHNIAIYVTMSPYEENHLHTCTRQSSCCHVSQRTLIKHCKEFWIFTARKESSTHPSSICDVLFCSVNQSDNLSSMEESCCDGCHTYDCNLTVVKLSCESDIIE